VITPPEPARPLAPPGSGPLADCKDWSREPAFVQLPWSKRPDGSWWRFADVAPTQLDGPGVFVIWRNGGGAKVSAVMYVGRGSLRDEFARCHRDSIFRAEGLYVTWATVYDMRMLEPIGAYLYSQLCPIWGEAVLAPPMPVNLPLSA
jgi:hypothetical protein